MSIANATPHQSSTESSTGIDTDNIPKSNQIVFVITGFGPFHGVDDNPTTILVNKLQDYVTLKNIPVRIVAIRVLKVAADAVKREIDDIYSNFIDKGGYGRVIVIHLGVSVKATKFKLERYAYNNATFRVPDEDDFQPKEGET